MLARKFDWNDDTSVYKKVVEELCQPLGQGKYSFVAIRVSDDKKFAGAAYESTVGMMCEFDLWKLKLIPSTKKPGTNIAIVQEVVQTKIPKKEKVIKIE